MFIKLYRADSYLKTSPPFFGSLSLAILIFSDALIILEKLFNYYAKKPYQDKLFLLIEMRIIFSQVSKRVRISFYSNKRIKLL